jgi:soluble cytochrome b562
VANVGYATLSVIPSFQGFQSRLSAGVTAPMTAAGRDGGRRYGDAAGKEAGSRFRGGFAEKLKGFAPLAGLAAGAGAITLFTDVINEASSAQQAVGGVQAVFGEFADEVIASSERAAVSLGLSATAYQELVTVSGAMLKNKGLEDFADQADNLIQIGADLAAQYGGTTKEAVEALNSAMRGESDPIERYAISLNETAVNAKLAATGQDKLTGAALEQAKTTARLTLIQEQSADALGASAREADTFAGKQAVLTAKWEEMKVALGTELLPAMTQFVGVLTDDALPALEAAGSLAKDAVQGFLGLPGPVQAATGAFVALKVAALAGVTTSIAAGAAAVGSAMVGLRLRTMLATDAYRAHRAGAGFVAAANGGVIASNGRVAASFVALRVAAQGSAAAMGTAMKGTLAMVGGPWGAAFIVGAGVVMKFWQEHQEAKQRVDDLATSLNQQTGALTKNTRATIVKRLEDEGALKAAQGLGISLEDMTSAAMGNEAALGRIRDRLREVSPDALDAGQGFGSFNVTLTQTEKDGQRVAESLQDVGEDLGKAKESTDRMAEATRDSSKATKDSTESNVNYTKKIKNARDAIRDLMDAENARREANVQSKRDQLALISTMQEARREARRGKQTLDENTKAGQDNWAALLDLADQWNNSTGKVRNARGAYANMRDEFLEVAQQMGATEERAERLVEQFLKRPPRMKLHVETPGMKEARRELERLRKEAARDIVVRVTSGGAAVLPDGTVVPAQQRAMGGLIGGVGTGTSDSNLVWASKGEFMQRKAAVDYYGVEFMRKLNNLQLPKLPGYAQGGLIQGRRGSSGGGGNTFIHNGNVVANDPRDYVRWNQSRSRLAGGGGVVF